MFGFHRARGAQGCGPAAWGRGGHHGRFGDFGMFRRPKYNVPVNVVDNDTYFEVHVYATGFDKENVKISVQEDVLYISGTRTIDEENAPNFSSQEFPIKNFERMLYLNGKVDTTNISAKQENGVLIITLPKTPEAQKPSQEIKVE